eukprot:14286911-Alexandrium_andersonii.AAC.1
MVDCGPWEVGRLGGVGDWEVGNRVVAQGGLGGLRLRELGQLWDVARLSNAGGFGIGILLG